MKDDRDKLRDEKDKINLKWFIEKVLIPLLVAIIAAYAAFVAASVLPNPFSPPSAPTSPPAVSSEAFPLAGVWEGTDSRGMLFRFVFYERCNIGDACGKVELPAIGCTATPVLVSSDGDSYEFDQTNHQNCDPDTTNDLIKVVGDGTLLYGPGDQPPTTILYKK